MRTSFGTNQVADQVVNARTELKLTQKELAERMGYKQSNISRLESETYNLNKQTLKALMKIRAFLN